MSYILASAVCLPIVSESVITEHRYTYRRMSSSGLTSEAQLRYMIQWFEEFSELQREDFLPILAAAHGDKPDQLTAGLSTLTCEDKPLSLFQCRIKLFNEWYPTWNEDQKERLIKAVTETDPDFGEKLQDILTNGIKVNGMDEFFATIEYSENNESIATEQPSEGENLVTQEVAVEIAAAS
ncbi:uncharacterized protein C14orf119 [Pieris rapae]|uniref:uncharacterized protein C14orf119 n=1 Tax=Pieris rapae TaxID=64459 RepID=UPI000B926C61|nr:uncharacterized protein C14orf119 [Pieris rapae]